jgi:prepilin-type N-terminal cleavage/methylation domain-containing protein
MTNMRRGVTLVELLLVLALLVIIGALAMPLLANSFSQARLRHGGELLRAAWGKARLAAMQSGETHVFRYEPEGSRYQTAMLTALNTTGSFGGPAPTADSNSDTKFSEADILRLERSELPEGVTFSSGQLADTQQLAGGVGGDGNWSSPILFFADGTTTDAVVFLANAQQKSIRVTLRGLTGISRAGEIGSEAVR